MKIYKNPDFASEPCGRCGNTGGCGGCGGCSANWILPCLCCLCRCLCNGPPTGDAVEGETAEGGDKRCRFWCGENGAAGGESDGDENGTCDGDRRHRCERLGCWDDCYDEAGRCRKCYNYCGNGYATEQVLEEICARSTTCRCKSESLCDRTISDLCRDPLVWEKPHGRGR